MYNFNVDRVDSPFTGTEEISYAHRNLLPRYQLVIQRITVRSLSHLEELAIAAEKCHRVARAYRPIPPPGRSLIPDLA